MLNQKLRVRTGCERCKLRKKKCDEARPQCAYCRKWGFGCAYKVSSASRQSLDPCDAEGTLLHDAAVIRTLPTSLRALGAGRIDPFHIFPVASSQPSITIDARLWRMFRGMIDASLPFDCKSIHVRLATGWLHSAFNDASVCTAFVAYISSFENAVTNTDESKYQALHSEKHLLRLLQRRIDSGDACGSSLSQASSIHMFTALMNDFSTQRLESLGNGVRTILKMKGESSIPASAILQDSRLEASRIMLLSISDHMITFTTGKRPLLADDGSPKIPSSLQSHALHVLSHRQSMPDSELERVVADMRLALSFRHPSTFERQLTKSEAAFLFLMLNSTDVQLRWLNFHTHGESSCRRAVVLALMIMKEAVFRDVLQHKPVLMKLVQELATVLVAAIDTAETWPNFGLMAIWSCVVATYQLDKAEAAVFHEICSKYMERDISAPCSSIDDRKTRVRTICGRFLWHDRLESAIDGFEFCDLPKIDIHL